MRLPAAFRKHITIAFVCRYLWVVVLLFALAGARAVEFVIIAAVSFTLFLVQHRVTLLDLWWRFVPVFVARWTSLLLVAVAFGSLVRANGLGEGVDAPKLRAVKRSPNGWALSVACANVDDIARWQARIPALSRQLGGAVSVLAGAWPGLVSVSVIRRDATSDLVSASICDERRGDGRLPVALDQAGAVVGLDVAHTLVVGVTGSGKGSVAWSLVRAVVKASGLPHRLFALDPKRAEFAGDRAGLFDRVAYDPKDMLTVLHELVALMRERQAAGERSFTASHETPLTVVVIDEFVQVANGLGLDRAGAAAAKDALTLLLTQSRSAGFMIVAFTQTAAKADIGALRSQFGTRIALRLESKLDAEMALTAGAVEAGATPWLIGPANASNGYATAGVGFMQASDGQVRKVRFPFHSDDQLKVLSGAPREVATS